MDSHFHLAASFESGTRIHSGYLGRGSIADNQPGMASTENWAAALPSELASGMLEAGRYFKTKSQPEGDSRRVMRGEMKQGFWTANQAAAFLGVQRVVGYFEKPLDMKMRVIILCPFFLPVRFSKW